MLLTFFVLFAFALVLGTSATPAWQSLSYYGTPISATNVGGVIFDPITSNQCFSITSSGGINITLVSCPFNVLAYFSVSSSKAIVLAKNYPLLNSSSYIPDCSIACNDSTGPAVYAGLTIQILSANSFSPVWNNSFPTYIILTTLVPFVVAASTPATDADTDKTTDGRVTYSVQTVDGSSNSQNNYFTYDQGGNSSNLIFYNIPTWTTGTNHTAVVQAQDNPKSGTANVITKTLTFFVSPTAVTGTTPGSVTTTTGTTESTSTGSTTTGTTTSTVTDSTVTAAAQSATTASSSCSGAKAVTCNGNWIWIVVGLGVLLLASGGAVALVMFLRDKNKNNRQAVSPRQRKPPQTNQPPTNNPFQAVQGQMASPYGPVQHPNYYGGYPQ